MFSRSWRFGWDRFTEVDLFSDPAAETLSQALRAAASEEPDADGSVLFGQLQGTVVGLRYYTGVVRLHLGHRQSDTVTCSSPVLSPWTGESGGNGWTGAGAPQSLRPQRSNGC